MKRPGFGAIYVIYVSLKRKSGAIPRLVLPVGDLGVNAKVPFTLDAADNPTSASLCHHQNMPEGSLLPTSFPDVLFQGRPAPSHRTSFRHRPLNGCRPARRRPKREAGVLRSVSQRGEVGL